MPERPLRILLIEDDEDEQLLIRDCLRESGLRHELDWANRLSVGREMLARTHYDAVLADLSLPDSRGHETVASLSDSSQSSALLILTTLDDLQTKSEALASGAQDYVIKSEAAPHSLKRAIEHAVQRKQALKEKEALLEKLQARGNALTRQTDLLNRQNHRLKKLYATSRRFVDNVSHEFRTPLTVVREYVSLLREGVCGTVNADQQQLLEIVADRASDLSTMVDDMLDISRLEAGLLGLERRACHLAEIVDHVRPSLQKKADLKQIELTFPADLQQLPPVFCDPEKIGRVLVNLTVNAIKFCGDPGRVLVDAQVETGQRDVVVAVTDNGPGISPENRARIFRRFKQVGNNPRGSTKGFGLGLSIAQELVHLNFGEIRLESELGQGSTFSFTIPIATPQNVLERYIDWLSARRRGKHVSLARLAIDPSASTRLADDTAAFLSDNVRRNQLVLRDESARWLWGAPGTQDKLDRACRRLEAMRQDANRNRLGEPLPEIRYTLLGTWDTTGDRSELLRQIAARQAAAEQNATSPLTTVRAEVPLEV